MPDLYGWRTSPVKPKCTPGVLYPVDSLVHDTYMAAKPKRKAAPSRGRPEYGRTFIKQWRKYRNNMSQEVLAERVAEYLEKNGIKVGFTHATIGRIENGKLPYKQPVLEAIAWALETDPASLLARDPADTSPLWIIWDRSSPAERQMLSEMAEVVLKRREAG